MSRDAFMAMQPFHLLGEAFILLATRMPPSARVVARLVTLQRLMLCMTFPVLCSPHASNEACALQLSWELPQSVAACMACKKLRLGAS